MRIFGLVGAALAAAVASVRGMGRTPRDVLEEQTAPPPQAVQGFTRSRWAGKVNPAGTKLVRKAAEGKLGLRR